MYTPKPLTESQYQDIMDRHPEAWFAIEQSPHWWDFEREMAGRTPLGAFGYYEGDTLVATASISWYRKKLRNSLVLNRGPVWLVENTPEAEDRLLRTLIGQFKGDGKYDALFLRLHLAHPHPQARNTYEPATYDRAVWVDISRDEKALLKSFSPTARNSIRKARRAGVEVREIAPEDVPAVFSEQLWPIMEETTSRNGFRGFDRDTYIAMLRSMEGVARLYAAYKDDRPLCWLISTEDRGHAVYYFAAGNAEARRLSANFLMQWEVILQMKERGNTVWNMTGVASDTYPGLENVTKFKMHFSKEITELTPMFDVPLHPAKYKAVTGSVTGRRALMGAARQVPGTVRGVLDSARALLDRSPASEGKA